MTTFKMTYGRRFRTAPYETAEIEIEDTFDAECITYFGAHEKLKNQVDLLVDLDRDSYEIEAADKPRKKP